MDTEKIKQAISDIGRKTNTAVEGFAAVHNFANWQVWLAVVVLIVIALIVLIAMVIF